MPEAVMRATWWLKKSTINRLKKAAGGLGVEGEAVPHVEVDKALVKLMNKQDRISTVSTLEAELKEVKDEASEWRRKLEAAERRVFELEQCVAPRDRRNAPPPIVNQLQLQVNGLKAHISQLTQELDLLRQWKAKHQPAVDKSMKEAREKEWRNKRTTPLERPWHRTASASGSWRSR